MTNEEKAREIANRATIGYGPNYLDVAEDAALEMAEWKDKQFKEYLEKKYDTALNAWDDWAAYDPKTAESWRVKVQYIHEIINELFEGE